MQLVMLYKKGKILQLMQVNKGETFTFLDTQRQSTRLPRHNKMHGKIVCPLAHM